MKNLVVFCLVLGLFFFTAAPTFAVTGPSSVNVRKIVRVNKTIETVENCGSYSLSVSLTANSGGNSVTGNTTGGSITTGSATVNSTVIARVNQTRIIIK